MMQQESSFQMDDVESSESLPPILVLQGRLQASGSSSDGSKCVVSLDALSLSFITVVDDASSSHSSSQASISALGVPASCPVATGPVQGTLTLNKVRSWPPCAESYVKMTSLRPYA